MSKGKLNEWQNSVAVIGMSCRFPGADNTDQFWQNLRSGTESISFFSEDELAAAGVDTTAPPDPNFVGAGSILSSVDMFDAEFFGFTPREAESLDPQKRVFLEEAWHALEDGGYDPAKFKGLIGVYAGCAMSSYLYELESNQKLIDLMGVIQVLIGNDKDYLTTLVSYKLDLKGPSLSIQTTCSTSLVAVCVAWQSLLNRQCDMALAGGVCIRVPEKAGYYYEPGGIYSPDGHCRVFDAKAQGVVFGNGVGVVLLKRLADAIRDRDAIHAVIRGAAINNDGANKGSYTAPGLDGQAEVISRAQMAAGVEPGTISYIEAHGTGTPVGDPIEIAALAKAFGRLGRHGRRTCAVGSVKTNFGHLDHAAGVAGLIKTVLSLKHKCLPPSLHFESPNPMIDFRKAGFQVITKLTKWKANGTSRRAGVSAFGIGGTNAHVVLEEAPPFRSSAKRRPMQLVLISAKSRSALENGTAALADYLDQNRQVDFADVAYTTQVGRRGFNYRRMMVARSPAETVSALRAGGPGKFYTAEVNGSRDVVFMFSGQGSQYVNMGAELYATEPTFRKHFDECAALLHSRFKLDLVETVYPSSVADNDAASERLRQTALTQPALFTIEYALAQLWIEWGIRPRAMIGHSIGEYVAACLAGVFSLADGLTLVAERGRMMQELPSGSMLAVPLPEAELNSFIGAELSIAAVNESSMSVVAGPSEAIERLASTLSEQQIESQLIHTSHAFHSSMMDPIRAPFFELMRSIRRNAPRIPYVSNVTGTWITAEDATDPNYWVEHFRGCVRFADGLSTLLQEAPSVLLEVGPGQALSTFARRHPAKAHDQVVLSSLPHPRERQDASEFILTTLGKQWLAGVEINWPAVHRHQHRRRVHVPTYSFDRQRYWAESTEDGAAQQLMKKPDISDWFYVPSWKYTVLPEEPVVEQSAETPTKWLLFDDGYLGTALGKLLENEGCTVVWVRLGSVFSSDVHRKYEINPGERADYAALFEELRAQNLFPDRIAHLWGVSADDESLGENSFECEQQRGLYSLMFLAQAIIAQDAARKVEIGVITNGLHAVTGEEELNPNKATVLAICKAIPQEYPDIRCRSIDVVFPTDVSRHQLATELLAELSAASADTVVAYREGQRWAQFFEPVRLTESAESIPLLREGGVYLITGGLGNIGLELAEELARSARANLVLIGRSGLPPRGEWSDWMLNHEDDDLTCRKIRRVQAIESMGSQVVVFSADIADQEAITGIVDRSRRLFGEINGVIHAAGTIAAETFAAIDMLEPSICEQHFKPKVQGLLVLEKALRGNALDFWFTTSSLSSVLAGLGFTAYAAANIFLDSFAAAHNWVNGSPWISVNWDAWNYDEDEHPNSPPSALNMSMKEGVETFRRILSWGSLQQVVISASDLQLRLEQWITPEAFREGAAESEKQTATLHARPNLLSPYVAPRGRLEQSIAEVWQEVLGIDQIGVQDNFFTELGGSSLLATQLIARLRSRVQTDLPIRQFFEGPTIGELALAIEARDSQAKARSA